MYCPLDNTLAAGPPAQPDFSPPAAPLGADAIITSLALFAWFRVRFSRFEVADHSMAPLLAPGDYLLTRLIRNGRSPERGDIVVFRSGPRYLVKRVIGLPGETLRIEAGVLLIDGKPFSDLWWSAATRPDMESQVPADSWFVLGDNRSHSADDSRSRGPVGRGALHSVVVARYWPLRGIRRLP